MDSFSREKLLEPSVDYRYLLDRGYPESSLKKLVGDRYRLSGPERLILYRGISTAEADRRRSAKRTTLQQVPGELLEVDFYNVAFTLLNYRLGRPLFRATDGFVRDAGALHGRLGGEDRLNWILPPILETIGIAALGRVIFYLDSPVSHSGAHAAAVEAACEAIALPAEARVVRSADYPLKRGESGVIATGDSAILDATRRLVIDLSAEVLQRRFNFSPPSLGALLSNGPLS